MLKCDDLKSHLSCKSSNSTLFVNNTEEERSVDVDCRLCVRISYRFLSWWILIMWRYHDNVVPLAQTSSGTWILRLQRLPHFPSRRPWSPFSKLIVRRGDEPEHRLVHHLVHLETLVGDAGVVAVHREAQLHHGLRQLGLVSHLVGKCAVMNSMTGTESNRSFLTNLKLWKEQSYAFCPQC